MNTQTAAHTPRPWHSALKDTVKDDHWAHIENGKRLVAFAYGHDQESKANARLIAAAPDLLAACEEAGHALTALKECGDDQDWESFEPLHKSLALARAAIAKAKGQL